MDRLTKEYAYGELALEITIEVLEADNDIRLSDIVADAFNNPTIKAAAARLSAERHNPDYENERCDLGMAHGNLLQPQHTVNDLCDEIREEGEGRSRFGDVRRQTPRAGGT